MYILPVSPALPRVCDGDVFVLACCLMWDEYLCIHLLLILNVILFSSSRGSSFPPAPNTLAAPRGVRLSNMQMRDEFFARISSSIMYLKKIWLVIIFIPGSCFCRSAALAGRRKNVVYRITFEFLVMLS